MSETSYVQHYTRDASDATKSLVSQAATTKTLTLNTNTAYIAGRGDDNGHFNNNAELQSVIAHGKLMGYDTTGKLLMQPRVSVSLQNGHVSRNSIVTMTPATLQGFGRLSAAAQSSFNVPHLDMSVGSASGVGGFVLSAPKLTIGLKVIPDPSGVLDSGEIIYHYTLIGTGEVTEVYLVIDEDYNQQRLENVPEAQAFMTANPQQVKELFPDKSVRWLKLPVGTLGDDVVQLSETNLLNESRLLVQDTITVIIPVMKPESETELMDAIKAVAGARGYTRVDHI